MSDKKVNLSSVSKVYAKAMVDQEFKSKLLDEKIDNNDLLKEHQIETDEQLRFEFIDIGSKFNPDNFDVKINFKKNNDGSDIITFMMPLPTNLFTPVKVTIGDSEVLLTCC